MATLGFDLIDGFRNLNGVPCAVKQVLTSVTLSTLQVWSGPITQSVNFDPWPEARSFHTAVCLHDPVQVSSIGHHQLLVLWGMDQQAEPLNDVWLLDIDQLLWKQVSLTPYLIYTMYFVWTSKSVCIVCCFSLVVF